MKKERKGKIIIEKRISKPKIRHNWKILIIIFVLLVSLYFVLFQLKIKINEEKKECNSNADCVKQRITCCPCSSGGEEVCMLKTNSSEWEKKLGEECGGDLICPAVYNCQETLCVCREGKCINQ